MKTLTEVLTETFHDRKDKVAIRTKKETVTYGELCEEVPVLAGYLRTIGVRKGDRILLEAVSEPSYILFYLALQRIGAVTAPVERGIKTETLDYLADLLDASMYFSKNDRRTVKGKHRYYEEMRKEAAKWNCAVSYERPEDDFISEIIFTTGTTGKPKAAMHSISGMICNTGNTVNGIGMREEDVVLLPLPLNHSFGMRVLRSALWVGATVVLQSGAIFADSLKNSIRSFGCNAMACVSATMESVLREIGEEGVREVFGGLRYIEFSAGAVPVSMREKLLELLPDTEIHNTWGSSETGGCLFLNLHDHPEKIHAAGKALDHIELGIYSDEEETYLDGVGEKNTGRLAIRGEMIFKGYFGQEDVYRESVQNGWLITQDLVYRDEDGYYYILGRADDVINMGGEKVAPSEIENALFDCRGINGCACIGIPDEEGVLGEVPMLLYVLSDGAHMDEETINRLVTGRVGVFRAPKKYLEVKSIPKNYMKKTDRRGMKKAYRENGVEGIAGFCRSYAENTANTASGVAERKGEKAERENGFDGAGGQAYDLNNSVIRTILGRKSRRKFTEEKVPEDVIDMLVRVGKSAPSGKNLQTRRFTVIRNPLEIQRLKKICGETAERKHTSFHGFENPPLLILISNDRRNRDGVQDVGVAAENIMIAAESCGFGSVWLNPLMDISDEPEIRQLLDEYTIPKNHIVWAVMAVGIPSEEPPEFYRKQNEVYYVS
ncbi:MAG: AMP-binding protein [Bacillota bacterium]|nr:AMP-binding protein [Bacillota bacterium]